MVIFKELTPQKIKVAHEWRDHQEQIITLLALAIGFLIGLLVGYFLLQQVMPFLIFLEVCVGVLILYYLLPGTDLVLDLPENRWDITYKVFGIPYYRVSRKISDTSKIVAVEHHQDITKVGRIFWGRKLVFESALQIWGFEESNDREKITLFKRKMYNSTSNQGEFKKNCEIGKKIERFLQKSGLPIEFDIDRDSKVELVNLKAKNSEDEGI
jgi:hypothetical protein